MTAVWREHLVVGLGLVHGLVVDGEQLLAAQEVVDGARAAAAGGDGLDGRPGAARGGVAAGEHALAAGGLRCALSMTIWLLLDLDAPGALGEVVDHALAGGEDRRCRRRAR